MICRKESNAFVLYVRRGKREWERKGRWGESYDRSTELLAGSD
jgi:hypothetical protein